MNRLLLEIFVCSSIDSTSSHIHPKILSFLAKQLDCNENKSIAFSKIRTTPCPLPSEMVDGSEEIDGAFHGIGEHSILDKDNYNLMKNSLNNAQ